ncbi:DUF2970 domain-containing protein [Ectopseudomonas mendocina]|uniref:DUF2970 domain-containing protein n=1 Tax=Ectopseudomonas mendocina TaxID=300 RepID=A0ABZ2RAT8_ECTME
MSDKDERQPLTLKELLQSVLSAALGVQSGKNRARDFSRGTPGQFIILGVTFTILFVLMVYLLVRLVLHFAGV